MGHSANSWDSPWGVRRRKVVSWWRDKRLSRDIWTFLFASWIFDLGLFVFFFLYNLYLLDCGFNERFLGLVASALAIGSIAGTIPAGLMVQRAGIRTSLLVCVLVLSVVSALRALVMAQTLLLALAFLGGATFSLWAVSLSPAVAQLTDEKNRPFAFSLVFSSAIAVGVLGGQVGGHLPALVSHFGVSPAAVSLKRAALLASCGIALLAAIPLARLRFPSPPPGEKKLYSRNPFLLRFLVTVALWTLVAGAFTPFYNAYFSHYLKMPVEQVGTMFSISQFSQVVAMLLAPAVYRRCGLVTGIMYMQMATAFCLGGLALSATATSAAIGYASYTAFQWMSEPGMYALLMNRTKPEERSGAASLNALVMSTAQAIAGVAAGSGFVRFGYPAVIGATALVGFCAALLFRYLMADTNQTIPDSIAAIESVPKTPV